jgi:hypothetical protein
MSAQQILEETASTEHHARARESAKVICQRVVEMLDAGVPAAEIHRSLEVLYDQYRAAGDSVPRDAFAEVLDWFEGEGLAQPA